MSLFEDPRGLQEWFERTKGDRTGTERTWQDIDENCFGMRNFSHHTKGIDRTPQIYDTTALFSNQLLAGAIHGMMTNPSAVWYEILPQDRVLLEDVDVRGWFETVVSKRMNHVLNSAGGGFTTAIAETYMDIPAYGMSTFSVEADPRTGVRFIARDLNQTYCELDERGNIDVIFREVPMTARTFAKRYPNPIDEIKMIAKAFEQHRPETAITVVEMIAQSTDPYAGTSPFRKRWTTVTWTTAEMKHGKPALIELRGFDEKPILTPRWSVRSGETYGFGPGWISLADAKMLNVMQLTIIKAGQKAADPPLLVSNEAVLSGIRTHPGGVNYVQERPGVGGAPEAIRPLDNKAKVDISFQLIEHKVQSVRNAYWSQILQMFSDPRMTATQVIQLANETQRLMAPMLGRLERELIEPLLRRTFNIMLRGKWFGTPPQLLSGQSIDITYISPITRSQRQHEAQAVMLTYQGAQLISEAAKSSDPMDLLNHDENVKIIAEANALPSRALQDQAAVQAARAERSAQAENQQQIQQAGQGAAILQQIAGASQSLQQEPAAA